MPTYDYECEKHGNFELFQSISSDPIKICPKCKDDGFGENNCPKVKRLISKSSFVLVGSGWAKDNYK
jgi:putative FmdB family regulatory protein